MPYKDPKAQNEYMREYRKLRMERDPEFKRKLNGRTRARHEKMNSWFAQYKTPCVICGEDEKCCIDFHHINDDTKISSVGTMVNQFKDKQLILDEMAKCVTLCSNCHRKVHAGVIELDT